MSSEILWHNMRRIHTHTHTHTQTHTKHNTNQKKKELCVCVSVLLCVHGYQRVFEVVELRLHWGLRFFLARDCCVAMETPVERGFYESFSNPLFLSDHMGSFHNPHNIQNFPVASKLVKVCLRCISAEGLSLSIVSQKKKISDAWKQNT